jgi:flagellin-like protein
MRKGVSPVVATVLLIAIAVISAVAVWYWVSPLTSPSATPSTTSYGFVVTGVYKNVTTGNCTSVDIKNSGGTTIPTNTLFEIFNITGTSTGKYVGLSSTSLTSGTTANFNITSSATANTTGNIPVGSYLLRASKLWGTSNIGFTDVYFTC